MRVDPFVAPIPKKILNDQELRPFFEYFVRWAHDLWIRTGGADDAVESTQNRDLYDSTMFQSARSNSNELDHFDYFIGRSETQTECESYFIQTENEEYYQPVLMPDGSYFQSISSDITTSGNQTLVCTAALTVTLNASPKDGELVRIKRVSGQTIIDGNSRSIDGDSTYTMLVDYEGVQVVYSALDDEWFKI